MVDILKRVYASRRATLSLNIISHASVVISALAYISLLVYSCIWERDKIALFIVGAGVPLVLVSIMRKLISAPRPYELHDFYEKKPKDKKGESFPSRHVFSAFAIGTLAFTVSHFLTLALILVGLALAVSRVLLGMHFIRDVVCGALIGVISGVIAILMF